MDRKLIEQIAKGEADDLMMNQFDELNFSHFSKEPSMDFTKKVMSSLPRRASKTLSYQTWGIIVGFILAGVLWSIEGFTLPDLTYAFDYFGFNKSFEMTGMLKGFMMINALLVLLLIDRALQRRRLFS